jgi:hypothetical protein
MKRNKKFTPVPEQEKELSSKGSMARQEESKQYSSSKKSGETLALYGAVSRQYETSQPASFA